MSLGIARETIALVERGWDGKHILVIGDVMLDKYIHGTVDRISPEAPVPIVHASHRTQQPGGAANVAMNIAGLGARASIVGFTGDDEDATHLWTLLRGTGVEAHFIAVPGTPTTSKLRILGGSQQMVRLDIETTTERSDDSYVELVERVRTLLVEVDAVVLSDYAKGVLTEKVCHAIITASRAAGVPVLVDPKSHDFSRYRDATTISPNLKELALATGDASAPIEVVLERGQALVAELGLEYLTVTLGEKGITVLYADHSAHAAAVARQVFDVSGAGDTVIATLALAAACEVPVEEAARLANVAAGIVVGKLGTVPVARHELVAALTEFSNTDTQEKTLSIERLLRRAAEWRIAGETIVFTNGCFDILHVGHIALLEDCRRFGDKVVVGINSDASVRQLKGAGRPIIGEVERARILSALAATDAIVIFDQSTPMEIILGLRPDVLVKGGDYTQETVVGAEEVKSWGGRVVIVPTVAGFSTTGIVRKMSGYGA